MTARVACVALLLAAACGGDSAGEKVDAGSGGAPDAMRVQDARAPDAQPRCSISISVAPSEPFAGATPIVATATRTGATGFVSMFWRVTGPPGDVSVTKLDPDGLRISFVAPIAGPYIVGGDATSGTMTCAVPPLVVNVVRDDANVDTIRLSYVPQPGQDAPPQADRETIAVRGGADYFVPSARVLERGTRVAGTVTGPVGALAAYLRLQSESGAGPVELFADAAGKFNGAVPTTNQDVLVIPYGSGVPAMRFLGVAPAQIAGFALDAGDAIAGKVLDAADRPVAGATVAVSAGDLPPLLATTADDGSFASRVRASAGALGVVVLAPRGDRLSASSAVFAPGGTVEVRLAEQGLAPVSLVVRASGGAALPGARVTFVTGFGDGGSLSVDGGAADAGRASFRRTVVAGDGGALPPLSLPAGPLTAIVLPPSGSSEVMSVASLDLAGPLPEALASAAPLFEDVGVAARDGPGVAGARVTAVARGVRGVGTGLAATAVSTALGTALLSGIVPGMTYDVVVDPPPGARLARGRASLVGGDGGITVALAPAIELTGHVLLPSGTGQPGVRVEARREGQPELLAETITSEGGFFSLWLPDPGVKGP